jgi:trehalose/maltose hydrolase-like predicted phosphorylase
MNELNMSDDKAALASVPTESRGELALAPTSDPSWLLVEEGFNLAREHEIESIFAIGNGYLGIRASLEEGSQLSSAATFAAGVYVDDLTSGGPKLAVLPEWPHLEISIDGDQLSMSSGETLEHRRILDLRQGILWREWRQQDLKGRITRVRFRRLASLADPHVLLQSIVVTAENYAGRIALAARLIASDATSGRQKLTVARDSIVIMRADETTVWIAAGSVQQPTSDATKFGHDRLTMPAGERWWWDVSLGETVHLDRPVIIYTSRDCADPAQATRLRVAAMQHQGVEVLLRAHVDAWRQRWDAAEVSITGDDEAQQALRFAVYHLISAANPMDEHASIGARGLTGEGYHGHIFWDTEIYMVPFYIFTCPPAARALLMYRYHTLAAARRKAKLHGYQGALYAWESADTGEETTPRVTVTPDGREVRILTGEQEQHISADIAYAVWHYWWATGDDEFMVEAGAEILVETARFWASRAKIEADGRAHIRGVIGPDEYHETVDDNAYTNGMARWNLERAADAITTFKERHCDWAKLAARLNLAGDEPASWRHMAARLVTGFNPDTGLFEQFEGYSKLKEVDTAGHRGELIAIDVWLGREGVRRSKVIKQADVVALSALLWDQWPRAIHEANFRYYEPRTAHGSSLSPAFHALVAARLDDGALALGYLRQAAEIDLANNTGHAASGVHMAALSGLWQAVVFGIIGIRTGEEGIGLDPHLPPGWTELSCAVRWRSCRLRLRLYSDPMRITVEVDGSGQLTIAVIDGPACRGYPGRRYTVSREDSGWAAWQQR